MRHVELFFDGKVAGHTDPMAVFKAKWSDEEVWGKGVVELETEDGGGMVIRIGNGPCEVLAASSDHIVAEDFTFDIRELVG